MSVILRILDDKAAMLPLYPLIQQLNPNVTEAEYAALLDAMLGYNYRMAAAYDDASGDCLGLSGYWIGVKIYSGKYLEMDNVVVSAAHRSSGIGRLLTDFLLDLARREGCRMVMLDAYRENERAHAFYERQGFIKRGYHFLKTLD